MKITEHGSKDWCHICGRREFPCADIWYPSNAEHKGKNTKYIRICSDCAYEIGVTAEGLVNLPT